MYTEKTQVIQDQIQQEMTELLYEILTGTEEFAEWKINRIGNTIVLQYVSQDIKENTDIYITVRGDSVEITVAEALPGNGNGNDGESESTITRVFDGYNVELPARGYRVTIGVPSWKNLFEWAFVITQIVYLLSRN